ncbi:MAG: ankyrin repeat domain-containing protein [Pseudomonadota bacterium]|nr:ankyrin repeat domain-containing protein [Pseudomonadota bacterium]
MQRILKIAQNLYGSRLVNSRGLCYGITVTAIIQFLHNRLPAWLTIQNFLVNYLKPDIHLNISAARKQNIEKQEISSEQQNLLEVNAFLEEIILFQQGPLVAADIYPSDVESKQDYKPTDKLLYLDESQQLICNQQQIRIDSFETFSKLLIDLKKESKDKLIAFSISFRGHIIAMLPIPKKDTWLIIDHDNINEFKSLSVIWTYLASNRVFIPQGYDITRHSLLIYKISSFSITKAYTIENLAKDFFIPAQVLSSDILRSNPSYCGEHLIQKVSEWKNTELLEELHKLNFDLNVQNKFGQTLLHTSVINSRKNIISWLLPNMRDINLKDNIGRSALYIACLRNKVDIVKLLLEAGCDPDSYDLIGETPLQRVASCANYELFSILIKGGANIYKKNKFGETILHYAAGSNDLRFLQYVRKCYFKDIDLNNLHDNHGNLVIHNALFFNGDISNNISLIDYLVNTECIDINSKNNNGENILHLAAREGLDNLVINLVSRGADLSAKTNKGLLPLHIAAAAGRLATVSVIINQTKPDILNAKTKFGKTALHLAVNNNNFDIVMLLLEKGASINSFDNFHQTPLHIAVNKNNIDVKIMAILIEFGALLDVKNKKGLSPLDVAKSMANEEKYSVLKKIILRLSPQTVADFPFFQSSNFINISADKIYEEEQKSLAKFIP